MQLSRYNGAAFAATASRRTHFKAALRAQAGRLWAATVSRSTSLSHCRGIARFLLAGDAQRLQRARLSQPTRGVEATLESPA